MICSVYDTHRRCYDYYEVPGTAKDYGSRGQKYRTPTQQPQGNRTVGLIGFAPEALALPLPPNAQHVGTGPHAKDIICAPGSRALAGIPVVNVTDRALTGLAGLGDAEAPLAVKEERAWSHVVLAAVIAGVTGVVVQKMLK